MVDGFCSGSAADGDRIRGPLARQQRKLGEFGQQWKQRLLGKQWQQRFLGKFREQRQQWWSPGLATWFLGIERFQWFKRILGIKRFEWL